MGRLEPLGRAAFGEPGRERRADLLLAAPGVDDNAIKREAAQVKDVASLPGRQELIAKLLFLLQSPVTRFVRVLAAVPRDFVVVLEQVRVKKEQASA